MIRVAIVDDHALVRSGLRAFLSDQADLVVTAEGANGTEAVAIACSGVADLMLLDIAMPGANGIDALKRIRQRTPTLPVVVLSGFPETHYATAVMRSGAMGYLNKDCEPQEIIGAIRSVAQKEFAQIFPQTGWVEHDPREIWASQIGVAVEALGRAQIRPQDIGFIRPHQDAVVKLTAYDPSVYGSLKGKVERISADTITDQQGNAFFKVRLRTNQAFLGPADHPLPIIPGMQATVEILTGRKTVLEYMLHPILRARDTALRER